jgi:hypothetical protein
LCRHEAEYGRPVFERRVLVLPAKPQANWFVSYLANRQFGR